MPHALTPRSTSAIEKTHVIISWRTGSVGHYRNIESHVDILVTVRGSPCDATVRQ
jgi:hypothetical protein